MMAEMRWPRPTNKRRRRRRHVTTQMQLSLSKNKRRRMRRRKDLLFWQRLHCKEGKPEQSEQLCVFWRLELGNSLRREWIHHSDFDARIKIRLSESDDWGTVVLYLITCGCAYFTYTCTHLLGLHICRRLKMVHYLSSLSKRQFVQQREPAIKRRRHTLARATQNPAFVTSPKDVRKFLPRNM